MHIDVNIYSAAKFILEITKKYTDNNTLILFDELINYPFWWNNGEYKALAEVYSSSQYKYLALDHTKRALIQLVQIIFLKKNSGSIVFIKKRRLLKHFSKIYLDVLDDFSTITVANYHIK